MPSPSLLDTPSKVITPPPSSARRTLLVVDDEEGPRLSLWTIFKDDYQVFQAEGGAQAIALARKQHMDAAVLDIRMPVMTGTELLVQLKTIDRHIEVVMLTGYETPETIKEALRAGACDYLNKPFNISIIRDSVARAMHRRAISDEMHSAQIQLENLKTEISNQQTQLKKLGNQITIYASVLHDISNPLSAIGMTVELILEDLNRSPVLTGECLEQFKSKVSNITFIASNCIEICKRYLSYLRQKPGDKTVVSLQRMLEDLKLVLKYNPHVQEHSVSISPLAITLPVQIHSLDLLQILINLVNNALQSSPQSIQVEVFAQTLPGPLDLSAMPDGPQSRFINRETFRNDTALAAISVHDTGTGIPPQILPRLFETFFTTKAQGAGTGLGLSIVRKLVENAGGGIHVQTCLGRGTTFTVYFPVATTNVTA